MMQTEFDEKAATWDENPGRIERAKAIARSLIKVLDLDKVNKALEYGSGTGLLSFALKDHLHEVVLMDESKEMTRVTEQKVARQSFNQFRPQQYDLLKDELPTDRFDLVYTLLTMHHIADTAAILQKFSQLLNPGGRLAIIDLEKEDGSFHDGEFHGHEGFERADLEVKMQAAGFQIEDYQVIYQIEKETGKGFRYYPLFLLVGRKA